MAAYNLHSQGEKAVNVNVEAEVGVREDRGQSLHFTVDHNNFLPCVTVTEAAGGEGNTVEYRPVWWSEDWYFGSLDKICNFVVQLSSAKYSLKVKFFFAEFNNV